MLSCFIAILQPRDTERGGKKIEENKKRCRCLCPLQKMWLCHLWNTADTAVTRELWNCSSTALKTKLHYGWRKCHHRLISSHEGWWINLTSSSKPKHSDFLADYLWFLLHCFLFFFFLTQDRKGHEIWWKVRLCSIQWTCTQQNHKSLITFSLSTPQQETCVIYVHNGTNKDVDYLGHKWASVTVTHCCTATCCSLAEGWRQICLSQKRE